MALQEISGFVEEIRDLGSILFLKVYSNGTYVQITVKKKEAPKDVLDEVAKLTRQTAITATGELNDNPAVKIGKEMIPKSLKVIAISAEPLPLDPSGKTQADVDTRFRWRVLDLRDPKKRLIFQITTDFEEFAREYFINDGFIEIHTPKLIGAPSESGASVFALPYFGREAFLAQSPQFYKQMAMCAGFGKVFEIGPVFRAEKSRTFRHNTEFTSLDVEISHIKSFDDVVSFEESWLVYILKELKAKWGETVKREFGVELVVPETPFPRISMKEAYDIVEKAGVEVDRDSDLSSDGEKALGEYVKEKLHHEFVFLTGFPVSVRAFYHMKPEGDPSTTLSADLLYKGVEITTLAQREHRYDILVKQAKEKGLHLHNIEFYLDFFKYGAPTHGGFGFGIQRVIMQLLGLKSLREATFIPRDPETLFP
ncbi:MAG: aspartate--tRNA(Asn) ligase [Candidatus Micrarchaeales archaeon]|nr:aspartate--tRNA(Asn) ligase [Candidatus Micrarchaeales archaeon]